MAAVAASRSVAGRGGRRPARPAAGPGTPCGTRRPARGARAPCSRSRWAQQAPVVRGVLGEAQAGVEHDPLAAHARGHHGFHPRGQLAAHVGDDVVVRPRSAASRCCAPRQCMTTYGTPAPATTAAMSGSARPPLTSLTSAGAGLERRVGHLGAHRVDADHAPRPASSAHDRADPAQLLVLGRALGAGPGRLATDVDQVGALGEQLQAVRDGGLGLEPLAAVGEGVGRHVDHAHDDAARSSTAVPPVVEPRAASGQVRNASASRAAIADPGQVGRRAGRPGTAAPTPGWNLALNRYSDSIWNQREANSSTRRQAREHRPAPIRSPRARAERNTAKFSDTRLTPSSGAPWRARRRSAAR